ncbi:hypothetical protein AX16_010519 [Volvariella volvacea WC 439]|nr:hypothetical protein AX16_010519 [Volvariella volvacea WC 439]
MIGLVLVRNKLYVWMCDRSGAIGTKDPIDIYEVCAGFPSHSFCAQIFWKDPMTFIRVIAALHVLPPELLGWDTSMKLYDQTQDTTVKSWTHRFDPETTDAIYQLRWVFTMPMMVDGQQVIENGKPQGRKYVTVDVLSIADAEIMYGRATTALVVVEYDKRKDIHYQDSTDFFVIKQSYRPVREETVDGQLTIPTEASFYIGVNHNNVAKLVSWEDVSIRGEVDSTLGNMHHNLPSVPYDIYATPQESEDVQPEGRDQFVHRKNEKAVGVQNRSPLNRIYCRLLLKDVGCSVKFFRTMKELVAVLKDTIKGHEHLYKEHGVLQRDCSLSNMLIHLVNNSSSDECDGCVIDLDHAKRGVKIERIQSYPLPDSLIEGEASPRVLKMVGIEVYNQVLSVIYLNKHAHTSSTPTPNDHLTGRRLLRLVNEYITTRIEEPELPPGSQYTLKNLKWQVPTTVISFANHKSTHDLRTGTLPFMSHEILFGALATAHTLYKQLAWPQTLVHDAPHDMESVFWSLLYLCLTHLVNVVYCLFDGDAATLLRNKNKLFANPSHMDQYILSHVHIFFDILKPLLRSLWDILVKAFCYRGFEYWNIHEMFLQAITDFESEMSDATKNVYECTVHESAVNEQTRREAYLARLLATAASGSAAPKTPPAPGRDLNPSAYHSLMGDDQLGSIAQGVDASYISGSLIDTTPTRKKPRGD